MAEASMLTPSRDNPMRWLSSLAHLPPQQQRQFLLVLGASLQQQQHMVCNPFGGTGSCMELPSNSSFADVCKEHDLKVDCAWYSEDLHEVAENPTDTLKAAMMARGVEDLESACTECFDAQRRLWCSQTVPKCGSFGATVETTILPALTTMAAAIDDGQNHLEALANAVPSLLNASSLSMPCRAMCEAVIGTCSCKKDRTFGELLDSYIASHPDMTGLPPGFSAHIFQRIHATPLCTLFADTNTPGFAGHCDASTPAVCSDTQRWCSGDGGSNVGPLVAGELVAAQMARAMFGWVAQPGSGLAGDEEVALATAGDSDVQALQDVYVRRGGAAQAQGASSHTGLVVLLVCVGLVAAGGGAFAWFRFGRPRLLRARGGEYVPMASLEDGADYRPPAEEPVR
ncbi:hypothetical protein WJX81_008566 [Elliptochloris bilobata]|uniref:Uncharacterized protein n=1 Tax=Elliptochloris bilobata TaxID=381761 RepID=A0AAW1S970_9CHLO